MSIYVYVYINILGLGPGPGPGPGHYNSLYTNIVPNLQYLIILLAFYMDRDPQAPLTAFQARRKRFVCEHAFPKNKTCSVKH